MSEKKLHRFFIVAMPKSDVFELSDHRLIHQLVSVLRYRVGETFILFSEGGDDVVVSITAIAKHAVTVSKQSAIPARFHPSRTLIAAVSIIKRDAFELVVQKLTELGVSTIVPLLCARTVKQSVRLERLKLISLEAVEQSGRNTTVTISEPLTLAECFATFDFPGVFFDPHVPHSNDNFVETEKMVMYIGPEGGWSTEDMDLIQANHAYPRKLGTTILRTETAAIVGAYELLRNS